jgi:PAS domain S-box-containing protein
VTSAGATLSGPTTEGTLLDLLPDAVICVDVDHRVMAANAGATRFTGYSTDQLLGRACHDILEVRSHDGQRVWVGGWHPSASMRSVRALPEQEFRIRTARGVDVLAMAAGSYQRDSHGCLIGAVFVLRDARRRADHVAAGLDIVSAVSHELRSPLTSIKGYTTLLLSRWERLKDDDKHLMLQQVHHDANRVSRLVTELLDVSRLETGGLVLRRRPTAIPKLVATVVDKVRLEYPGLEADVDFPAGFPDVNADPDKVEQVLTNLIENACKYASPKGISIVGATDPALVSVTVSDRGAGIAKADLPKVFVKFFRRSEGRPTGSGLGLWISQGLIEAHGGRMVAESIAGRGSSFRFTLPLIDPEDMRSL